MKTFLVLVLPLLLAGCVNQPRSTTEYHLAAPLDGQPMPFSEAVRAGDMLYLAGHIGNMPGKRQLVPGGIGPEATQAMENIRAVLARRGA